MASKAGKVFAKGKWVPVEMALRAQTQRVIGELRNAHTQDPYDFTEALHGYVYSAIDRATADRRIAVMRKGLRMPDLRERDFANPRYLHKQIIVRALAQGKTVPRNVLAFYPDLVKKG